jgi:hypothetical protein
MTLLKFSCGFVLCTIGAEMGFGIGGGFVASLLVSPRVGRKGARGGNQGDGSFKYLKVPMAFAMRRWSVSRTSPSQKARVFVR